MAGDPDTRLPGAGEAGPGGRDDPSPPEPLHQSGRRLVYLAAERTLLTWIRAAIAMIVLGFAVDRFGLVAQRAPVTSHGTAWSSWLGIVLIGCGVAASAVSGVHYWRFLRRYERGDTRPGPGIPLAIGLSCLLALAGVALAAYLWLAGR
jgi:uncharacterized membrane protein YidH (DUF202 family)